MRLHLEKTSRVLLPMLLLCIISAHAFAAEQISGVVTSLTTGNPISLVDLDVFNASGASVAITNGTSGAGGVYTLTLPGPGTYTIRADASRAGGRVDQYFDHVFLPSLSTPIVVASGALVSGIDFSLSDGVEIQGTVTSALDNSPLGGIDMDLYASTGEFLSGYSATTAVDGTYAFGALPPGNYFLRADPDANIGQYYVRTYYGDSYLLSSAAPITVNTTTVTGIDIALEPGGVISGTVTESGSNVPLAGYDLDVYDANGVEMRQSAVTSPSGTYTLGPIPVGSYSIRVDPSIAQSHMRTFYDSVFTREEATLVVVPDGQTVAGIDFSVEPAGYISGVIRESGTLSPIAGIDLDCYDVLGNRLNVSAVTGPGGAYSIGPLLPGQYTLRADPSPAQAYARIYYNQKNNRTEADLIAVAGLSTTTGIDFELPAGASISGVVSSVQLGAPVAGMDIDIINAVTLIPLDLNGTTDSLGAYSITNVPPGNYIVRADPAPESAYERTYYGGATLPELAQVLNVPEGAALGNVDIELGAATPLPAVTMPGLAAVALLLPMVALAYSRRRRVLYAARDGRQK